MSTCTRGLLIYYAIALRALSTASTSIVQPAERPGCMGPCFYRDQPHLAHSLHCRLMIDFKMKDP